MTITTEKPLIRSAKKADLDDMVAIESSSGEGIWSKSDFKSVMDDLDFETLVLSKNGKVAALLIYEVTKKRLNVVCCVVQKEHRRKKYGQALFTHMLDDLLSSSRKRILIEVRESDLNTQLFLRAMGCRCVKILRGWYIDKYSPLKPKHIEDGYRFRYEVQ